MPTPAREKFGIPDVRARWLKDFTRYRPKRKRLRRRPLAVWDIETADGTLLGPPGGIAFTSERDFTTFDPIKRFGGKRCLIDFLAFFLVKDYRGFAVYAHKGMSFDLTHLFASKDVQRWLIKEGFIAHITTSFVAIRKGKQSWLFADSLRLIPDKLKDVLPAFAPEFSKAPLPITPFSWNDPAWITRIENDTKGLFTALRTLESLMIKTFNVALSLTMPATALRASRRMLPLAKVSRPSRVILDWIRAGCYSGGRIEVYWQGPISGHLSTLDINSAYAWAMKGAFPIGPCVQTRREALKGYHVGRCRVHTPENAGIPPVLSRLYHHAFCVGSFEAILTQEEIEFARSQGATVDFIEGVRWIKTAPLFKAFIDKCEKLRRQDYHGPLGKTVKLAQNGLYGILGMNPFRKEYMLSEKNPGAPWSVAFDHDTGDYIEDVWEALAYKESPNQMAHWAAIITARVRVRLSWYLMECEKAGLTPLYAHTDSIWLQSPNGIPPQVSQHITNDYGSLKLEREGPEAIVVGPGEAAMQFNGGKCSHDTIEKNVCQNPACKAHFDGQRWWHIASKGWAATPEDFLTGRSHTIEQTQVFRAGTGLKRQFVGRTIKKVIGNYEGMRNRRPPVTRPGPTRPHVAEAFNYSYFHLRNWRVGKLYEEPPLRSKARLITPEKTTAVKKREHINRSIGQIKRADREFVEDYADYLKQKMAGVPERLIKTRADRRQRKRRRY